MAKKKKHTILIVEDQDALQDILSTKFLEEGFRVVSARDGEEALTKALEYRPDVIILDLLMPKIDGRKVLQKLRTDSWGKLVPVIVYTNVSETEGVDEVYRGGSYDYMVKANHSLADVVARVRERLIMQAGLI